VTPMAISWVVFACTFVGALLGMFLRRILPEHHINEDSKDLVKLGMGLIATMAALVLALLIASAKSYHDLQNTEVTTLASDFILLDRTLARYGPETKDARNQIPGTIESVLDQTWSKDAFRSENLDRAFGPRAEMFYAQIRLLEPRTDFQRAVYAQVMDIGMELGRKRSFLLEQTGGSIPTPFLVVLVFWLALIFAGFGLFAPTNSTVFGILVACALSVAAALFLILELDHPFQGLMQISGASLRDALVHLAK
jgi:Protein of unknown function (DUF4239)